MADQVTVYVSILKDSLKEKYEVMQKILDATKRQAEILSSDPVDADAFDEMLSQKEELISRIFTLDGGFERVFSKVNPFIQADPQSFKPEILEMQNYIRIITECSMKIQALEQKIKNKFEMFVKNKRKEIRDFNASNKTAASYYQNMSNQHHQWQTYFVDQKK